MTMSSPSCPTRAHGRVSVLVITYNQERFVRDTLASVQLQRYPDVEIVVADDGSTDGTADVIRQLASSDERIVPVLAERNRGIASNLNAGIARCTGEFVAYLGGDDLMLPGKIERQVAFLRAHPECAMCVHDMEVFEDGTNRRLYLHSERYGMPEGGIELEMGTGWTMGLLGTQPKSLPSAQMIRASALPDHGFDTRLRYLNDWLHGLEVLRAGRRGYVPEVLGRYRRHQRQVTSQTERRTEFLEEYLVGLGIIASRYPDLARRTKELRRWILFQRALHRWDPPDLRDARDRQVRVEAGVVRWCYLILLRLLLNRRLLLSAARPLLRALRALLRVAQLRRSSA